MPTPLPPPWSRSWSISQSVLPLLSGSIALTQLTELASQNGRHHPADHVAQTQDEGPNDDGQGHVTLVEQVAEVQLGRELVERHVAQHNEENCDYAKGDSGEKVSEQVVRQMCLHRR